MFGAQKTTENTFKPSYKNRIDSNFYRVNQMSFVQFDVCMIENWNWRAKCH